MPALDVILPALNVEPADNERTMAVPTLPDDSGKQFDDLMARALSPDSPESPPSAAQSDPLPSGKASFPMLAANNVPADPDQAPKPIAAQPPPAETPAPSSDKSLAKETDEGPATKKKSQPAAPRPSSLSVLFAMAGMIPMPVAPMLTRPASSASLASPASPASSAGPASCAGSAGLWGRAGVAAFAGFAAAKAAIAARDAKPGDSANSGEAEGSADLGKLASSASLATELAAVSGLNFAKANNPPKYHTETAGVPASPEKLRATANLKASPATAFMAATVSGRKDSPAANPEDGAAQKTMGAADALDAGWTATGVTRAAGERATQWQRERAGNLPNGVGKEWHKRC